MATIVLSKIEKAMLHALAEHKGGITARKLAKTLAGKGYPEYLVQRVMQRGLDRGDFELGPNLQFQAHIAANAAPKHPERATARRFKR
jgi:hypothetical protein